MKELKDNYWNTGKDYSKDDKKFCFFETDDFKYIIIYDDIGEYGILNFVSSMEIWQEKEKPELIFKSEKRIFAFQFDRSCYYLEKTGLFVLLTICIPSYQMCYMIMDIKKGLFAKIDCINYNLCEDDKGLIHLESNYRYFYPQRSNKEEFEKLHGAIISLQNLNWLSLNDMTNYCQLPMYTPKQSVQSA
jgi:hypothetical protein